MKMGSNARIRAGRVALAPAGRAATVEQVETAGRAATAEQRTAASVAMGERLR
jgi:hypothetical protein